MFHSLLLVLFIVSASTVDACPDTVLLSDGNRMPILSFGTFGRVKDVGLIKPAVIQAIETGYRQIDTAAIYQNEEQVGEAIADVIHRGVVTREDLFITTKLNMDVGTREGVLPDLRASLQKLQLEYVDLYLIHTPKNLLNVPKYDYLDIWKGMEEVKKLNLTRSIGVSNFESSDVNKILLYSETKPSVNEIEVNPSFTNLDLVAYCQSLNITVLSYGPFGFLVPRPFVYNPTTITFKEPILVKIANKYGKTTSQVVIRYLMDRGTIPIPRSTNTKHIKQNFDVFDFSLTPKEIYSINELNTNAKTYNFDEESFNAIVEYFGL